MSTMRRTGYLNAADAAALDAELLSTPGFRLEQLMELAGLSVAEAVYQAIPAASNEKKPKVLLICGPGNNGGDGLVAARHLVFFGYECIVVYPKRSTQEHFVNLVQQCEDVEISVLDEMPTQFTAYDAIVDAIFGFSFQGAPREPFVTVLEQMMEAQKAGVPVISVDVPSGWNVDEGDVASTGFVPEVLVSLTTPKESARTFTGRHFVGGRFLPPKLAEKYSVQMPPYPGVSQVMEVTMVGESTRASEGSTVDNSGWEADYAAYMHEKYASSDSDPPDKMLSPPDTSQNEQADGSWERQYAAYCAEKEARLAEDDEKALHEMKQQRTTQERNKTL